MIRETLLQALLGLMGSILLLGAAESATIKSDIDSANLRTMKSYPKQSMEYYAMSKKPTEISNDRQEMPGADKDAFGCITSAGYRWCAKTNRCERPWELAKKEGFENTAEAFEEFCGEVNIRKKEQ